MKLRVYGSTKPGYTLPVYDALMMSGHEAGICYMPDDFDSLLAEPEKRTFARVRGTVGSGHHSVSGHPQYSLILEGVPKILAMLINNEHEYVTSEKSGRYTVMKTDGLEYEIYSKWSKIFEKLIEEKYPQINARTRNKLALENARYFISVFTPSTVMGYTASLRQLNYIIGFCEEMYLTPSVDPFMLTLRPYLREFADQLREICNVEGLRDNKGRRFSLFATRQRNEFFDECYSVNYMGSFAQLAQAHRHRSLTYEMMIPRLDSCSFYVPAIIEDEKLRQEYLKDMMSLKENYPQGMMVPINERGTIDAFVLKCHERLCGAAQREICLQTRATLKRYLNASVEDLNNDIFEALHGLDNKTKCQFGFYTCDRPCPLGPKHAFDRLV